MAALKRALQLRGSCGAAATAALCGSGVQHPSLSRGVTYFPHPGDSAPRTVTLIPGDGIGPEITDSVVRVFEAMKAPIIWERFPELTGRMKSVPPNVVESIRRNRVCLKGTLFTPVTQSTDTQSMNVAIRKQLDLFANVVHCFNIDGVPTRHENLDLVIIRENTEGEYSGLEHEVVPGVVEALKVITADKSKRIAEYAFEYAYMNRRKKVTAVHKANIMKQADGLFIQKCREVAENYPDIQYEEVIIDNCCMQMVANPQQFDVMVLPNLYGGIVSNVAAGLAGGPGILPGGNIGTGGAVFEQGARHVGLSIASKGAANPSALLLASAIMLRHCGLDAFGDHLRRAVHKAHLGSNFKTIDLGGSSTTEQFTEAVIANL